MSFLRDGTSSNYFEAFRVLIQVTDAYFLYFCLQVNRSESSDTAVHEKGFNFDDARIMCGAWRNERDPEICKVDSRIFTKLFFWYLVTENYFD